jgi:hypothetical protein
MVVLKIGYLFTLHSEQLRLPLLSGLLYREWVTRTEGIRPLQRSATLTKRKSGRPFTRWEFST